MSASQEVAERLAALDVTNEEIRALIGHVVAYAPGAVAAALDELEADRAYRVQAAVASGKRPSEMTRAEYRELLRQDAERMRTDPPIPLWDDAGGRERDEDGDHAD